MKKIHLFCGMISYEAVKLHTKIKQVRELRNLTRDYLADELGINVRTYADIENGKINLSVRRLFDICNVLSCTLEEMLNFSPNTFFTVHPKKGGDTPGSLHYMDIIRAKDDLISQLKAENARLTALVAQS